MSTSVNTAAEVAREQNRAPDGRFGPSSAPESDLTLTSGSIHPALRDHEVDITFPYPQANDLDKVVAVTDLVDGGADTADAVAHGLDMHPRQGAYYANAAGYLGLLESEKTTGVTTYRLTELGHAFTSSDPAGRAEMLTHMVTGMDDVQIVSEDGQAELARQLQMDGLDEATANRRAATIGSWAEQTDATTRLELQISDSCDGARSRCSEAAERARTQREEARRATARTEPRREICSDCNTEIGPAGNCGGCW